MHSILVDFTFFSFIINYRGSQLIKIKQKIKKIVKGSKKKFIYKIKDQTSPNQYIIQWVWFGLSFLVACCLLWLLPIENIGHPMNEVSRGGTGIASRKFEFFYCNRFSPAPLPGKLLADLFFHRAMKKGIIEWSGRISDDFLRRAREEDAVEWSATPGLSIKEGNYSIRRVNIIACTLGTEIYNVPGACLWIDAKIRAALDSPIGEGFVYLRFRDIEFDIPYFIEMGKDATLGSSGYQHLNQFSISVKVRRAPRSSLYVAFRTVGFVFTLGMSIFFFSYFIFYWPLKKYKTFFVTSEEKGERKRRKMSSLDIRYKGIKVKYISFYLQ